jgi:hypothetical protein
MSFRIVGAVLCGGLLIAMTTGGFAASNKKPPKVSGDRPGFFYLPCSGCDPLSRKTKEPRGAQSGKRSHLSAGGRRDGGSAERPGIYAVHPTAANR